MSNADEVPLLARQAILRANQKVFGYELLYRGTDLNFSLINDPHSKEGYNATAKVIMNTFSNLKFDTLSGKSKLFINFSREHILNQIPSLLPKHKVVIELLENCIVDDELIYAIQDYKRQGYTIALDDFEYQPQFDPLISSCKIIKVDIYGKSQEKLAKEVKFLKKFKVKLLAEKVETHEEFVFCKSLGFHFFQGYFFCKPDLITGKKVSVNKANVLRLLSQLNNPHASLDEIEAIISLDPKLTYRILLIVNSVCYRGYEEIKSIRNAVIRVGVNKIKSWAVLLMIQDLDDKPYELIEITIIRARICELIAKKHFPKEKDTFYLAGILSNIDALLNDDMKTLVDKLSINEEVKSAILNGYGEMGQLINSIRKLEQGKFNEITTTLISPQEFNEVYIESINYARKILKTTIK